MPTTNFVIGISSYSGGGETRVAKHLAAVLGDATLVHTDDYDAVSSLPVDFGEWMARGALPQEISRPVLAEHIALLRAGTSVTHPITQALINPAPYIVFDCPDGRTPEFTVNIDLMVFLDTPLDIAMARRILRDYFADSPTLTPELSHQLRLDLEGYLRSARSAYLHMDHTVRPGCDLIVDGSKSPADIAQLITTRAKAMHASG